MGELIVTDSQNYTDIASAIRSKLSVATTYKPHEMASAINSIPSGGSSITVEQLNVNSNNTYTAPTGKAYSPVVVNVPVPAGYADVTDVTAIASDVKTTKVFVNSNGILTSGTLNFNWMGENPEFVKQVYTFSGALKDTSFNTWSPATTASTCKASETLTTKETLDLGNYDYILLWESDCNVAYSSSWSASKGSCLRNICLYAQGVFSRPASVTAFDEKNYNYNATQEYLYHIYINKYYSSASAISTAYTTYSPFYISSITAPTFSSTSSTAPQLTIKTPTVQMRCSTTYFTTANAGKVDKDKSTVKLNGYLYRVKVGTSGVRQFWAKLVDIWGDPL